MRIERAQALPERQKSSIGIRYATPATLLRNIRREHSLSLAYPLGRPQPGASMIERILYGPEHLAFRDSYQ